VNKREEFEEYSLLNRVLVNQPLLAGNPVSRDYKLNKIDFDRGQIAFELQRRDVIYNVKSVYYGQVLAEEALKISTQDLQRGREARDLAKRKFNAGFIPEVDLMRIQVDLARREGEFSQTEARAESAKEQLRLILGLPVNQQIAVNFPENRTNAEFGTVESISGKRLETEADELSNQGLNMRTDATITDMRIRASLQLYYEVDTRWDKTSDIDKSENRNRGVSLHFEFPIYGFGTTVTEIENLKIAKKKSVNEMKIRKANLEADTRRAVRDLDLSRRRMDIVSASLELSRKTLSISEDRFENGLINSRELIDAQADLTRGNQEWLNARIDYELALAYLERIAPYHRQ
jgi:outer membrane protein TolC